MSSVFFAFDILGKQPKARLLENINLLASILEMIGCSRSWGFLHGDATVYEAKRKWFEWFRDRSFALLFVKEGDGNIFVKSVQRAGKNLGKIFRALLKR